MSEADALPVDRRTRLLQIGLMILGMTLAAVASVIVKGLTNDLPVLEILWIRLILGSLLLWPLFIKVNKQLTPTFSWLHLLRAVILTGMTGLWFLALAIGPVTQAAVLSYTYPIFVLIFAAVFFKERIQRLDMVSLVFSFGGVLAISQFGWSGGEFNRADVLQLIVVVGSSILIAIRMTVEKVMTYDNSPEDILLGSMILASVILIPFAWPEWQTPDLQQTILLIALAATATLPQLFVIYLLRSGAWSVVSIFAFWEVIASIILGIIIFSESLSAAGIVGAVLIVAGGMFQIGRK